jgi:hypothetical protein
VSFNYERQKNGVLRRLKKRGYCWGIWGVWGWNYTDVQMPEYPTKQGIYAEQAPEPNDVIWKNMRYSKGKRVFFDLLAYTLSIVIFVVAVGTEVMIALLISNFRTKNEGKAAPTFFSGDWFLSMLENFGPTLAIIIVNEFISLIVTG